jgi:succinoglycan biosynthesis transport protein ExoP
MTMSQPTAAWDQVKPYLHAFRTHYKLWVIPTLATTLLALTYALVMPRWWRANQAIFVRAEAIGNEHSQGQFDSIDRMKVFQETILEVARNHMVVASVLRKLGPPTDARSDMPWPTQRAIEDLQGLIAISAPKGSEFGRTDIFFLSVAGKSPQEAVLRTKTLCDEVEKHLGALRDAKARSMVRELEKALQLAQNDLNHATARLEAMEREIGPDLGELRVMNEVGSGDSNLRTGLSQVRAELRQAESHRESLTQLRELLVSASDNSDYLLATPSRLLDSQPGLKRLKEGLVDAQLRCAQLRGKLNDAHPTVKSALRSEAEVRQQLKDEVATALMGVEADLQASAAQIARLNRQHDDVQKRLDQLAGLRARYSNLVAEVKRRTEIVDSVRRDLSNAQASSGAAAASSLLTRFHEPVAGDRPIGPGKKTVVAGGMGGGLALGAGLVFLFMPIGPNGTGRRWNDYVNVGRRATDRLLGRRFEDRAALVNGRTAASGASRGDDQAGRRITDPVPAPPTRVASAAGRELPAIASNASGLPAHPAGERRLLKSRRAGEMN